MKSIVTKTLVFALFAPLLAIGCANAPSADHAPLTAAVPDTSAMFAAHDASWNAHDPQGLADLFADDGTLVTPNGTRVEGRAALAELFASPGPTKETTSVTVVDAVQPLSEGLVLVDAHQTLSGPAAEQLPAHEASLTAVLRLVDGKWRIVAARPFVPAGR